jgi:phosphate transport system ATP-binding protein
VVSEKSKIKVRRMNFYYGSQQALYDVDLQIREHFITALIGPSGCGKSTFLRSLNRMNDLIPGIRVEGSVELDGENVYSDAMNVIQLRRRIGMIFQRSNPFPMSVYDNVAYGLRVNRITTNRLKTDEIVEKTLRGAALWDEVKDRLSKSAMSLSGGQQQRLCIARALVVEPEVLLMDEPASALDPISTARIEELIYNLKRNYTIVIVTHNMQQAARVSDETGFFLNGRMVEFNETKKLFTAPGNRETEDYITGRFG